MDINQRVQKLLDSSKTTQKDLSSAIGVATSTLNNWLKLGRSIPSEYIIPICEFFKISPNYLLIGEENNEKHSFFNNTISNNNNVEFNGIKHESNINRHDTEMNENTKELVRVFESLPTKEQIRLMNIVYDYEEQYRKSHT